MTENTTNIAIALGGNLGEVAAAFDFAAARLAAGGVTALRRSGCRRTAPEDCPPGTPAFLNMAVTGRWAGTAAALLALCQGIEVAAGRPAAHGYHESRVLDLDLILFGDAVIETDLLTVPHPRAAGRRFVLEPLAEIAPDWVFPDSGCRVAELLARLPAP